LPSKWAKKNGIKKGDEIEVESKGSLIEISSKKSEKRKDIFLDISKLDRTTIVFHLRYHYRNGSDIIHLRFDEPLTDYYRHKKKIKVMDVINNELNRLMGMEIIDEKKDSCQIKCMVNENIDDFDNFLRKIFIMIQDCYDDLIDYANKKAEVGSIQHNHDSITRFISYCTRLLNKFGYKDYRKTLFLHSMLESLETAADIIEEVNIVINKEKISLTKQSLYILKKMRESFKDFVDFYYKYDIKKATMLNKKRIELENDFRKINNREKIVLTELLTIPLVLIRNIIGVRIGLESSQDR